MRTINTLLVLLLFALPAFAQNTRVILDDEACENLGRTARAWYCEVHELSLPANRSVIDIDGGQNGGLHIEAVAGGIRFDFLVMLRGKMDRRMSVDLGAGGQTIRAVTTIGGARLG